MSKSIFLFGCKDTTLHVAKFLNQLNLNINLITIDPATAKKNDVAGYIELSKYEELFKTIYIAESYALTSANDINHFKKLDDILLGFSIGWQRLIPEQILENFSNGVHGMHGSTKDLPFGKGRSPMNWSIIEGRNYFCTNLFRYKSGVDDGPIIDKVIFSIQSEDTAETLHYKNTLSMCAIIQKNIANLISGDIVYKDQELSDGESFYPKRNPEDGLIDWSDDINNINRLIRAVSPPFSGGIGYINNTKIKIKRASIFYTDLEDHSYKHNRFGEILEVFLNGKFLVRCSGGVLIIHESSRDDICVGDCFKNQQSPFNRFKRNEHGFFDN